MSQGSDPEAYAHILNDYFSSVYTVGQSDTENLSFNHGNFENLPNIVITQSKV